MRSVIHSSLNKGTTFLHYVVYVQQITNILGQYSHFSLRQASRSDRTVITPANAHSLQDCHLQLTIDRHPTSPDSLPSVLSTYYQITIDY